MLDALKFWLAATFAILPIVNPVSAAALLVAMTPGEEAESRARQGRRAVLFMTAILAVAFFVGEYVLRFFSISQPALVLAAGALVCRSGWRTITGTERLSEAQKEEGLHKDDISLTPLGMPLLAGPGTISVVIGFSARTTGILLDVAVLAAILVVAIVSYLVLRAAPRVTTRMGRTGEAALSKVMGLIILCVGIQFLINGFALIAPALVSVTGK